ncbi:hypothetical protein FRAHR75_300014 [Frankia sp. Hr75.2]|nr:hypothetical protein FRAHR75_300014 [Frankia sp. Hr75.2]
MAHGPFRSSLRRLRTVSRRRTNSRRVHGLRRGQVEQKQRVVVGGTGFGVVHDQPMVGGAFQSQGLVAEGEVTDVGVVEGFTAVRVSLDVVALPQACELRALEQEFTDELSQIGGVGVGASQGPEPGDATANLVAPVVEQVAGRGVEEDVAADVALLGRPAVHPREQPQPARVVCQQVASAADHVRGVGAQALQQQLDPGPHDATGGGRRLGGGPGSKSGQAAQMPVLNLLQQEDAGEGVDDGRAGAGLRPPFQTGVMVDADPRQGGQLLTAQAGRAAVPGADGQASLLGRHPSAASTQEAPQLGAAAVLVTIHDLKCGDAPTYGKGTWDALSQRGTALHGTTRSVTWRVWVARLMLAEDLLSPSIVQTGQSTDAPGEKCSVSTLPQEHRTRP